MMTKEAGLVVGALTRALLDGSRDLGTVPGLLVRIIDEELWRDRIDPTSGRSSLRNLDRMDLDQRLSNLQVFVEEIKQHWPRWSVLHLAIRAAELTLITM